MGSYVLRRVLQMIPVFFGTTLLIFLMVYSLPGDPVAALFGEKAADPAVVASIKHTYYLDQPIWKQYLHYMGNLFQGTSEPASRAVRSPRSWRTPSRSPSGWR